MDTQKILKKRDKKHKKEKNEKKAKQYSSEPSDEGEDVPVEQPPQINSEESGDDDSAHEDQRDAVDIKKISIVAEPGHSAAEADAKAESKFLK